jgi:hypothetical protein
VRHTTSTFDRGAFARSFRDHKAKAHFALAAKAKEASSFEEGKHKSKN